MFTRPGVATAVSVFLHSASASAAPQPDGASRREYLAGAGDCIVCHTRIGGEPYAGGYALHAQFGTVYASNITLDKVTGIGNWTARGFYRALHDGTAADGHRLYPAFPYPYFTHISRADSDALFSYLMSVRPVRYMSPPDSLIVPESVRPMMVFWNLLFLRSEPLQLDPARSPSWNRGALIVNGIAHCSGCHTPKNFLFADKPAQAFQGDMVERWFAPNLTGSKSDELGSWTEAEVVQYLRTGRNRYGYVTGSMQGIVQFFDEPHERSRSRRDRHVFKISAGGTGTQTRPAVRASHGGRAKHILAALRFLHQESVASPSPDCPRLTGNTLVLARDPTTMLRVILQGSQSAAVPGTPVGYSMPAFPVLTSEELASIATYIRNAWGNDAGPVTAAQAAAVAR